MAYLTTNKAKGTYFEYSAGDALVALSTLMETVYKAEGMFAEFSDTNRKSSLPSQSINFLEKRNKKNKKKIEILKSLIFNPAVRCINGHDMKRAFESISVQ